MSNGPKFIKISEEISFAALRKTVIDVVQGGRSLFEVFYRSIKMYM